MTGQWLSASVPAHRWDIRLSPDSARLKVAAPINVSIIIKTKLYGCKIFINIQQQINSRDDKNNSADRQVVKFHGIVTAAQLNFIEINKR